MQVQNIEKNILPMGVLKMTELKEIYRIHEPEKDPIIELIGRIVLVTKRDGRSFAARLLCVRGDEIWFSNKQGTRMMVKREVVEEITPIGGN